MKILLIISIFIICGCSSSIRTGGVPSTDESKEVIQPGIIWEMKF